MMGNPTCSGPPIGIQRLFVAGGRRDEANIATCFSSSQRKRRKFDEKARFGAHLFRLRMPRSQSRKSSKSCAISRTIPSTKARTSPSAMARVGPLESQTTSRACGSIRPSPARLSLLIHDRLPGTPTSRVTPIVPSPKKYIEAAQSVSVSRTEASNSDVQMTSVGGRVLSKSAPRTTSAALSTGSGQTPSDFSPVGSIQPSARRSDTTSAH
jgi:hypothetical protein